MTDSPSIATALLSPQSNVVVEAAVIRRGNETELRKRRLLHSESWRIEPDLGILTWQRTPESASRAPYEFSEFWGLMRIAPDGLAVHLGVHAGQRLTWTGDGLQLARDGGIRGECSVRYDGAEIAAFVRGRLFVQSAALMVSIVSRFDPVQGAWAGTGEIDRSHARLHLASELRAIGEE